MGWEEMRPILGARAARYGAITFGVGASPGLQPRPQVYLTIRPEQLDATFRLTRDEPVHVLRGAGQDAGRLRVARGGEFRVRSAAGKFAKTTLRICLPAWRGLPAKRQSPVTFRAVDGALEIDLPSWAIGGGGQVGNGGLHPPYGVTVSHAAAQAPVAGKTGMQGKPREGEAFSMLGGRVAATRVVP